MRRTWLVGLALAVWPAGCEETSGGGDGSDDGATATGDDGGMNVVPEADVFRLLAETQCKWIFECGCGDTSYADEAECAMLRAENIERSYEAAKNAALRYDGACGASMIAAMEAAGCNAAPQPACDACVLYHGGQGTGAVCLEISSYNPLSDCDQGLRCDEQSLTCFDACALEESVPDGEMCANDRGTPLVGCEVDSTCDATTKTCTSLPGPDVPCHDDRLCASAAYCDTSDPDAPVCVARLADDEPCTRDDECLSGYCFGACGPARQEGEECTSYGDDCAPGLDCIDDLCAPADPSACG